MLSPGQREQLRGTRFSVRWFEAVGSTNDWLLQQAAAGEAEGMVAVADHQSAGRGRRDRVWTAPPGSSLLTSILLRPDLPADRLQLVTAAVALSAAQACRQLSGVDPELKWPNDLMVKQWKLAGVLAESTIGSATRGEGGIAVVVGLGLNVNWPQDLPLELTTTAVALNYLSQSVPTPAEVLTSLLIDLDVRIRDWEQVSADYRSRCSTVGQRVSVVLGSEQFTGEAVGLDPAGRLQVRPDDGGETRTIAAADVVHLRAASHTPREGQA